MRRKYMRVSYNKMWKLLIDRKMTKADIRRMTNLSSCTMTRLNRDEPVSLTVMLKIAEVLNADISDLCEFVSSEV